jgi:hypothetical protein
MPKVFSVVRKMFLAIQLSSLPLLFFVLSPSQYTWYRGSPKTEPKPTFDEWLRQLGLEGT